MYSKTHDILKVGIYDPFASENNWQNPNSNNADVGITRQGFLSSYFKYAQ